MTLAELRTLLAPYADDDEIVFVDSEVRVRAIVSIAKDHGTTRANPDGSVSMPVAVYLDDGVKGTAGVLGGLDQEGKERLRELAETLAEAGDSRMEIAVVVKRSTLRAISEHSVADELGGSVPINETEALLLLSGDTLRRLLDRARPEDTRIDDVILRLAL